MKLVLFTTGLALLGWLVPPVAAWAVELETDLSTRNVEIRATFKGAQITVFGVVADAEPENAQALSAPVDVVVVVRGPSQDMIVRRKEALGPIWANRTSYVAHQAPSFYFVASTRPLDEISGGRSFRRRAIGLERLNLEMHKVLRVVERAGVQTPTSASHDETLFLPLEAGAKVPVAPPLAAPALVSGVDEADVFRQALIGEMQAQKIYSESGRIAFVRKHLFRGKIDIPATVPAGAYMAEVFVVQNGFISSAEVSPFFIEKQGIEGVITNLSQNRPIIHGLIAVLIAIAAGWFSEFAFRKR